MLKVAINSPSENSFLTVGQNFNQGVTKILITIFFAFLIYVSHIKIATLLGCIVRAEFKLSSPTHTPQTPGFLSAFWQAHVKKLCVPD